MAALVGGAAASCVAAGAAAGDWSGFRFLDNSCASSSSRSSFLRLQQQQQSVVGSRSSASGSGIRMALAVEKKFVTTKSEEIFTAAKVLHTYSLCCLPPCLFALSVCVCLSLSLEYMLRAFILSLVSVLWDSKFGDACFSVHAKCFAAKRTCDIHVWGLLRRRKTSLNAGADCDAAPFMMLWKCPASMRMLWWQS